MFWRAPASQPGCFAAAAMDVLDLDATKMRTMRSAAKLDHALLA
jgi:hypothetical protein